ncbi:hypothetical protein sos41_12450 [Alphaproteobacteria bacterium SO-S41]|nr:hypothetical protein sos41_12450 [Alphaproteobacteria bacterium SO-S41]
MAENIPPTYTITGENPDTGTAVIRAQVREADIAAEVARMAHDGLAHIRVVATRNPSGSSG